MSIVQPSRAFARVWNHSQRDYRGYMLRIVSLWYISYSVWNLLQDNCHTINCNDMERPMKITLDIGMRIAVCSGALNSGRSIQGEIFMKLLLLKCAICDYWYKPCAHHYHCPHCGSMPLKLSSRVTKYYILNRIRLVEVVRSVPRSFEQTINCQ